jgi:hypothetical protein
MLANVKQLEDVYGIYMNQTTSLPAVNYNYVDCATIDHVKLLASRKMNPHPVAMLSAGNFGAKYIVIGSSITKRGDYDSLYQWPFGSFDKGRSYQLTDCLAAEGIKEENIFWFDSANDIEVLTSIHLQHIQGVKQQIPSLKNRVIIALGEEARAKISHLGVDFKVIQHPNHWFACNRYKRYPLYDALRS